ncbi:MAG: AMP-binding protein [Acidimicrobiales bacterium]|nr:AMP-binding protein [Acidimicrobiales bacterium]
MTQVPALPTLWSLVERQASRTPDALLVVDEHGRSLTFGRYRERTEQIAAGLAARGIGPGTTVAWQLPTSIAAIELVGALARLGATQVPLLPIYREREVRFALRQTRPSLVITPSVWRGFDHAGLAKQVVADEGLDAEVLAVDEPMAGGDPARLPPPPADADPVRWVFFTSGTTGEPKGARHSDATIAAGSLGVAEAYRVTESDRYPIVFPFTHIGGIGMLFIQLATGAGAIAVEQFDLETTPPLLASHGLTIAAGGTPLALLYLQRQRRNPDERMFPDLRATMTGAAPTPPSLDAELRDELGGIGALACYGLTEMPFLTVSSVADTPDHRARTVGRAVGGAEIRVVDADGRDVAPGVSGEIWARGPQLCLGYLDAERNAEAFTPDGWLRTGDLGTLDADGFVTITGRLKDIIIRKGENISAKEVEDLVFTHPAVADVAVIGLPDDRTGERCCAVVVPAAGSIAPDLAELAAFCRAAGLANQKLPEQVEVRDELPRNASGKVLKFRLRDELSLT